MRKIDRVCAVSAAGLAASLLAVPSAAFAENIFSLHATAQPGLAWPGGGTGLSLRDAQHSGDSAVPAPSYGLRYTHFTERYPNWGVGVDFTEYRVRANTGLDLNGGSNWRRMSLDEPVLADRYVQRYDIAHGARVLSVNGIYRWRGLDGGRLQPYVGAGLAYYRPQTEGPAAGTHDARDESPGFGYQLMGGLRYRLTERAGAFVEAKFNSGNAYHPMGSGETETGHRNYHAVAGVSYSF